MIIAVTYKSSESIRKQVSFYLSPDDDGDLLTLATSVIFVVEQGAELPRKFVISRPTHPRSAPTVRVAMPEMVRANATQLLRNQDLTKLQDKFDRGLISVTRRVPVGLSILRCCFVGVSKLCSRFSA